MLLERAVFVSVAFVLGGLSCCLAGTPQTESKVVTGLKGPISSQELGELNLSSDLYQKGTIKESEALTLLKDGLKLPMATKGKERPTIIHVLQWADSSHTSVNFQQWYLWNPRREKLGGFYAQTKQKLFEGTLIPGESEFRLVYIHLSPKTPDGTGLLDVHTDSLNPDGTLKHPVSYKIDITKMPSQFLQDAKTLLSVVGVVAPPPANPVLPSPPPPPPVYVGYWGYGDISSEYTTSSVKVTPTQDAGTPAPSTTDPKNNTAKDALTVNTYTNEGRAYFGLGIAVPVKKTKDVQYQSSNGTLVPTTVTKQNAYATLDLYLPPALPGLMAVRYIPHVFIGLPLSGKVFQQPMVGAAVGLPWLQVFGGEVFDRGNDTVNGMTTKTTHQFTFGIKISVGAAASALKSASK